MKRGLSFIMLLWCCGLTAVAGASELYYTNRTFTPVTINVQGNPPLVDQMYAEVGKLTDLVKGTNITTNTNETYAIEKQVIALNHASAADAWNAAVAYNATNNTERHYPGKIYDNVGWVRGTKLADGKWGAYFWSLRTRIVFRSSETNWWTSPSNGVRVAISNVLVGSLGDYPPMADTNDIGPTIDTNFPGADQGESKEYQVDITNVYYRLIIPSIWITPRTAYAAVGGGELQFTVAGTNIPGGVTWTISPSISGGAVVSSNEWPDAWVSPGTVATNYSIRATSVDNTNFYDEVPFSVLKLDIIQTNLQGYVYCTNCVSFCLTADSWTNTAWSISPDFGTNGAQFAAGPIWAGIGTNTWQGTNVWVYAGPVSNTYTLKAQAVENANCYDTATNEVFSPKFVNLNWLESTNETLHHTSLYQTNALVLRRADKFKVEATLTNGYESVCFDIKFKAIQEFDGAPTTYDVPEVTADLAATNWYCKLLSVSNNADQTKTAKMEINIPSTNCPIGEYQWQASVVPQAATNIVLDTTNFPGQVIILFNPWSANDSVYMANDADRTEYVMRTSGIIWKGDCASKLIKIWQYAQFSQNSLKVLLDMLAGQVVPGCKLGSAERVSPVIVARHLSRVVDANNGQGLLYDKWFNWPAPAPDWKWPSDWSGTHQIIEKYLSSGTFVKYGQCWVSGGVLTSMLRGSGIPSRPLTNYDSAHDTNGNHIIERYFFADGTYDKGRSESIWNFHVWCDAWMIRPDQINQDGWQAVDATPQEQSGGVFQCGPASHAAVKGNLGGDYDVGFVFSEVNGEVQDWQDVPGGNPVLVRSHSDLVGHDISTKSVGVSTCNIITGSYK